MLDLLGEYICCSTILFCSMLLILEWLGLEGGGGDGDVGVLRSMGGFVIECCFLIISNEVIRKG